ncbi:MAG TPA: type II secretion system F family protein [Candidatus Polarisedimenticolia bacterium]|nr:type II secretion system F family protein [Candidatus Polarisedimenticolia bacterium]
MPEFIAKMGTADGDVVERVYISDDAEALKRDLERKDFLVFSIRRKAGLGGFVPGIGRKRVKMKEFLIFNQQLAALIQAGLPIVSCLDVLLERRKNPAFKKALSDIRDQVKSGAALSEAFSSQGDLFPPIYSSSLASGERSGEVASVLRRYIAHTKKVLGLKSKVIAALIYPAILFGMSFVVLGILLYYVLPKFSEIYEGFGGNANLPLITRVLVGSSKFVQHNSLLIALALLGGFLGFTAWRKTAAGALTVDTVVLKLPFLGSIIHRYCVSRFTRTLGTLVSGGIPLVNSLEIAAPAAGNRLFQVRLTKVPGRVREGNALAASLEQTGLFSDLALEMVKVGESTGALQEMLENVSALYDEEIDNSLQNIEALLVPVMLVFMGLVIASIMLAIYLPLIKSYGMQGR